jgi:hypothetical protein
MTPEDLNRQHQAAAGLQLPAVGACPDVHLVAAYVDGTELDYVCAEFERHLADCDDCMQLVGLLSWERSAGISEVVPAAAVERAGRMIGPAGGRTSPTSPQWAVAATVLLAVALSAGVVRFQSAPVATPSAEDVPMVRSGSPSRPVLQVLYPVAGAQLDPGSVSVRWTAVRHSRYYDVRIVTDGGDVVAEQRVEGTEWRPDASVELRSGSEYYVHVDAYPSNGRPVSSDHVAFRVGR